VGEALALQPEGTLMVSEVMDLLPLLSLPKGALERIVAGLNLRDCAAAMVTCRDMRDAAKVRIS
jgi:hypothetical protein